jgi:DNA-binding response OmpR family regulator
VVKPFSPRELMLRLNVLITRHRQNAADRFETPAVPATGLLIDFAAHRVWVDGQPADLTPRACELLLYLARNQHIALGRDKLITSIWGYDFTGDDRTLDTHIKMIRTCLRPYRDCITTLRGLGYRFDGGNDVHLRGLDHAGAST